jgi:hypothetical protein
VTEKKTKKNKEGTGLAGLGSVNRVCSDKIICRPESYGRGGKGGGGGVVRTKE